MLPLTDFVKNKNCPDGYEGTCKDCRNAKRRGNRKEESKKYYETHRDEMSAYKKQYYIDHRDEILAYQKERYERVKNTPHEKALRFNRKMARRAKQLDVHLTKEQLNQLMEQQDNLCFYCGCDLNQSGYHIDHIVPIAKGGTNDISNLVLACPHCNLSKGAKDVDEFLQYMGDNPQLYNL